MSQSITNQASNYGAQGVFNAPVTIFQAAVPRPADPVQLAAARALLARAGDPRGAAHPGTQSTRRSLEAAEADLRQAEVTSLLARRGAGWGGGGRGTAVPRGAALRAEGRMQYDRTAARAAPGTGVRCMQRVGAYCIRPTTTPHRGPAQPVRAAPRCSLSRGAAGAVAGVAGDRKRPPRGDRERGGWSGGRGVGQAVCCAPLMYMPLDARSVPPGCGILMRDG